MVDENLPPEEQEENSPVNDEAAPAESVAENEAPPAAKSAPTPDEEEMLAMMEEGKADEQEAGKEEPSAEAIPADQLESAGAVDEEVERQMLEELAKMESGDATMQTDDPGQFADIGGEKIISELTPASPADMPTVKSVEFGELDRSTSSGETQNIEILLDVKLPVSIELGRTEMTIHDILDLSTGSVVELNKLAGEPVDLLINNRVVAKGEVVVVDENFGLRVTSLISPEDRIKSL